MRLMLLLGKPSDDLKSVPVRHAQVEEKDVRFATVRPREALGAGRPRANIAGGMQRIGDFGADLLIVVYDVQYRLSHPSLPLAYPCGPHPG